ncbi:MAG: hypothetical protein IJ955_00275 [Oscillospiraceae bacterium]|nr:hypothetical protein [Oscillospiraceae bacterium]
MSSELVFQYNYSAQQNKEVQIIRDKYLPKQESGLDELKRLDRKVTNAGLMPGLVTGVLSCLVFGLGMCFALQVIGDSMALGAFFGVLGAVGMLFAYPVYRYCFQKAKETYQPRILELAAQLCGER